MRTEERESRRSYREKMKIEEWKQRSRERDFFCDIFGDSSEREEEGDIDSR